jgi:PIN domain nuclease of toxin-antitoxin system
VAYLLDTHVLIWAMQSPDRLPKRVRQLIEDQTHLCAISMLSLWEISIKVSINKLTLPAPYDEFAGNILSSDFEVLEINHADILAFLNLPVLHCDAFDRLLVAQALRRSLTFITGDKHIHAYKLPILWKH